jgi:hypothetical protein
LAKPPSIEKLWGQIWERGFQNIYVLAIPEYTEVMAFTDDVRLYYDGVDPLYCDLCDGYLEGEDYYVGDVKCPHVVKGRGETLLLALENVLSVR